MNQCSFGFCRPFCNRVELITQVRVLSYRSVEVRLQSYGSKDLIGGKVISTGRIVSSQCVDASKDMAHRSGERRAGLTSAQLILPALIGPRLQKLKREHI